ncbi:FtsX-like permease family protein [Aquimarina sp. ERC-38]|uniref:ABC transporter permease n=1 Tax=Aquimarina sp. ERC-38 TaxID=2949996 RepID=UPI002246484F|nr:FtsX-like permease family protein [Aquimarina sp. ERC-38]UZO79169.1 FtsX-like permease family protein [Aquimarina sp. ERC-38]
MQFRLAVRNIWRNKRRTLLTISAVAFAVFLSSIMSAFQKGSWDNIVDSSVNLFVGYAQIHKKGYWEDKILNNAFQYDNDIKKLKNKIPQLDDVVPRIESFALASAGEITHGVKVIGIDPDKENELTRIKNKIIKGSYLSDEDEVIIGAGISKKMNLTVGDTIILISQGYHGVSATGKYPISGIFEYAIPDFNKSLVFFPIHTAQQFFAAPDLVTTVVLDLTSENLPVVKKELIASLNADIYEVMDYEELLPEIVQARALDEASGSIVLIILYGLIAFTIFGTILMITKERNYEYGILIAIGMRRWKLFLMTFLETIILAFLGVSSGVLMAFPIVYYFYRNPIDLSMLESDAIVVYEKFAMAPIIPVAFVPEIFINQAVLIFVITVFLGIYPFIKILKINPMEAIHNS